MQTWVTEIMEQFGYVGIFLMMAIENIFPPIPSEVILPFGGFMTTYTNLSVVGVVVTATTGSVLGAIVLYGVGMLLDVTRLEKLVGRWGHIIRVAQADIQKADHWFTKYGYWTVLFCRMIPLIRSLISIPAGISRMTFWVFLLFTIIGTVVWNIVLILFGVFLGESWQDLLTILGVYSMVVYWLIGIGCLLLCILLIRKQKGKK